MTNIINAALSSVLHLQYFLNRKIYEYKQTLDIHFKWIKKPKLP